MSKKFASCDFKYRLAQRIQRIRAEHGYATVQDLAEASCMSLEELMNFELGVISDLSALCRLARFYGKRVSVDFID